MFPLPCKNGLDVLGGEETVDGNVTSMKKSLHLLIAIPNYILRTLLNVNFSETLIKKYTQFSKLIVNDIYMRARKERTVMEKLT